MTAALFALGEERTQQLHTFTCTPQQSSQDGEEVQHDSYQGLSLEQSMAAARARVMSFVSLHSFLLGPTLAHLLYKHTVPRACILNAAYQCVHAASGANIPDNKNT